jgi:ferric-dicitrate binding protein FerR (iron transport regulator)
MSERDDRNLTPDEEGRLEAALRGLGEVRADEEFRAGLRARFTAGTLETAAPSAESVDADPTVSAPPAEVRPLPRRRRGPRPWAMAALPAIAAVLALVIFGGGGPRWRLLTISGEGDVTVADRTVSAADRGDLTDLMVPGSRVALSDDVTLDLALGDVMVLGAAGGTEFVLPAKPGGSPPRYAVRVVRGDLMFKSGPGFAGRALELSTTEGLVEITGTTVAVYKDDEVTCVCVLEGTARIGRDPSRMDAIPEGMRKVMFADGREPLVVPIEPGHRAGLLEFERRNAGTFE